MQAIEAKDNVQIQAESVTLASNLAEDSEVTSDKHGMKNGIWIPDLSPTLWMFTGVENQGKTTNVDIIRPRKKQ